MEISVKNNADAIIFHTAICFGAKANSHYGRREIACANFSSPLRDKSLRNEDYYDYSEFYFYILITLGLCKYSAQYRKYNKYAQISNYNACPRWK